jgi:hypothetical protein
MKDLYFKLFTKDWFIEVFILFLIISCSLSSPKLNSSKDYDELQQ